MENNRLLKSNGLIKQWGISPSSSSGTSTPTVSVSFYIVYATVDSFKIVGTAKSTGSDSYPQCLVLSEQKTDSAKFRFENRTSGGQSSFAISYEAIGY